MTQSNAKFYSSAAKSFVQSGVNWKQLAKIDSELTKKWVDGTNFSSHKIVVSVERDERSDDEVFLHGFLDGEYGKSKLSVDYKTVSYLPSGNFQQIGLFAKQNVEKGDTINGIIGFLVEITDDEIVPGFNDVSILYSELKNVQWVMLGPISFVNASCKSNIEYRQKGRLVYCVALRNIKVGEELTVYHYRHFFGNFNVDCLCPYKTRHGDPCPADPEPLKKRRKQEHNLSNFSTPQGYGEAFLSSRTPVRKIFLEKLPPRRALYGTPDNDESDTELLLSYESVFGDIESNRSPQRENVMHNLDRFDADFEASTENLGSEEHEVVDSTPLRLDVFEDDADNRFERNNDIIRNSLFQDNETPLFAGSHFSTESFMREFDCISDQQKVSKVARSDFLKLVAKVLPVPNNLFEKLSILHLPTVSKTDFENASFCCVDIKTQIEKILLKNTKFVSASWSSDCSWETNWDCFFRQEIQLVLNIDGAPAFKSSKFSVWPIWVQVFNLPPKMRGAFSNLALLGLWHGKSKPDFAKLLPLMVFEIESLTESKLNIENLGTLRFRVRSFVADMPATACILCMVQFNEYSSCPHCYMKGFSKNRRMLFPVKKCFKLREAKDFQACGYIAEVSKTVASGVKSLTPLHKVMTLPWDCPIDPMHQIFLGTLKSALKTSCFSS